MRRISMHRRGFQDSYLYDMPWAVPFMVGVCLVDGVIPLLRHNQRVRRAAA